MAGGWPATTIASPGGRGTLALGRIVSATLVDVCAMRIAAVFTLTTVTIAPHGDRLQMAHRRPRPGGLAGGHGSCVHAENLRAAGNGGRHQRGHPERVMPSASEAFVSWS
jgi:hypothetical protein